MINIENNFIDKGLGANEVTIYSYATHAHILGNANINHNYFNGFSATENVLKLEQSCFVESNTFIRDAVSINSYIQNVGSNTQSVTNNSFDKINVDGSDEELVKSLAAGSRYERNKNQIAYTILNIDMRASDPTDSVYMTATEGGAYTGVRIDTGASAGNHSLNGTIFLSSVMPLNTKLMNISLSTYSSLITGINTGGTATFSLSLYKTITKKTNFTSAPTNFANSIIDIAQNQTDFGFDPADEYIEIVLDSIGEFTAWNTNTQYAFFSPEDTVSTWVIDKDYDLAVYTADNLPLTGAADASYQKCIMVRYKYL